MPIYLVKVDLEKRQVLSVKRDRSLNPNHRDHRIEKGYYCVESSGKKKILKKLNPLIEAERQAEKAVNKVAAAKTAQVFVQKEEKVNPADVTAQV